MLRRLYKRIFKRNDPYVDVTGIRLTPGNGGRDCLGNGLHNDRKGRLIQCCCDECNFLMLCVEENKWWKNNMQ